VRGLHDGRDGAAGVAQACQHPHAVEVGHHEIEDHQVDLRLAAGLESGQRQLTALDGLGGVAEATNQRLQQATLNGVVVDDQDGAGHRASGDERTGRSFDGHRLRSG
jgi:hypothetical protein